MQVDALYLEFGRLVRGHRLRLGLTQDALAEQIGLSRTSVTNIEKGRQRILLHQLFSLAEFLQVSPEALLPPTEIRVVSAAIEHKLGRHFKGAEREWARRIVVSSSKGGVSHATPKD